MKILYFKCSIVFLFVLFSLKINAQNITIPFSCGFEDTIEINNWVINAGPNGEKCEDQWMIGNLDYNEGYNSMYISCDTGRTTNYGVKPNVVIAYRPIIVPSSLDPNQRTYSVDISFDYKCVGRDKISVLNFYLLPESFISESELQSVANGATLPTKLNMTSLASLSGALEWTNYTLGRPQTLPVDTKFYMVFVWQNANTDTAVIMPQAACIDNIQITSSNCWKPENLQIESTCDTLWVNWEGTNEMYEFEYRPSGAKVWRGRELLKVKTKVVTNVAEGAYDVRVRGICGDEKSAWVTKSNVVCFCPDRHCINYVNLDREGVKCEIGKATDPTRTRPNIYQTGLGSSLAGPVDYGSNDKRSRHTINWKQGEYDPRSGNKLRTIPEGSLASVRLGNWDINQQAEGITYEYTVDTTSAFILLMKYAVVLEAPGHGPSADPYFKLEIIDERGNVIDPTCGEFEFTPENKTIKWNKTGGFVWKDWTSIGLNLGEYHGQTIQIRLITQDCLHSAHCGYAYFTLDCADAVIKSTSCGETIEMEMVAPDGFSYIWTRRENRDSVISTEQVISVPANDTTTYYCEVDYLDMQGCGFTLSTSVYPRFPYADCEPQWKPENCENRVIFSNKSCVQTRVNNVYTPTKEKCETFYWSINGGEYESSVENLVYNVPREGDTLQVTLMVGISDDVCQDDTTFTFIVPPIYEHYDTLHEILCEGNTMLFDNKLLAVEGIYTEYKKNIWGCDSITVLDLSFVPQPEDIHIYDTICNADVYLFNGKEITESGEYKFMMSGAYGCDSIVILHLEKVLPLGVFIDSTYRFVCADDQKLSIDYEGITGYREPVSYSIIFDSLAIKYGFVNQNDIAIQESGVIDIILPKNCRPNTYTVTCVFKDTARVCDDISIPISFDVYYSASILQPKFDNLIAVLDSSENGGYSFVDGEYEWYENGELVDMEGRAYFYLPDGQFFETGDCYYMKAKRIDDGVIMRTCEICPGEKTPIVDIHDSEWLLQTTIVEKGGFILLKGVDSGIVNIYNFTGQLISSSRITYNNQIIAPYEVGFYIVEIREENRSYVYKIWIK